MFITSSRKSSAFRSSRGITKPGRKSSLRLALLAFSIVGIACLAGPRSVTAQTPPMPSGSYGHTCALTRAGGVRCWGDNGYGQLGDGTKVPRSTPAYVSGLTSGVVAVTAASTHTCALMASGAVKCWGSNFIGQLGDGTVTDRLTPVDVDVSDVVAIAVGRLHTCALTSAGGVKCWGPNGWGQLGDGTQTYRSSPVEVVGVTDAVGIAAGYGHSCALTSAGGVKCWGLNAWGELGDGGLEYNRKVPGDVVGLTTGVSRLAAAETHTCAVLIAGGVKCWGANGYGQLGDGTTTDRDTPVPVTGLTSVVAIAAGGGHTCAVTPDGLKCWGGNYSGQLGDGTRTDRWTPTVVTGIAGTVRSVTGGSNHTCAATAEGRVSCWGNNESGQTGSPSPYLVLRPAGVPGFGMPTSDFNGDGWPDLVWHNRVTDDVLFYLMNGTTLGQQVPLDNVPVPRDGARRDINWRIAALGDFNGDEWPDIVWRHQVTGENKVLLLKGTTYDGEMTLPRVVDLAWKLVGAADFNADLDTDLVWRNQSTGDVVVWYMNGASYAGFAFVAGIKDPAWTIITADDFNGDGSPDLLWRNLTSGQMLVWFMHGVAYADWRLLEESGDVESWEIVGTGEFTRDGSPDIIWHSPIFGDQINDLAANSFAPLPEAPAGSDWALLHPSDRAKTSEQDFNADGSPDILWHHEASGGTLLFYLGGSNGARTVGKATAATEPDVTWKPVAVADFNRDSLPDIVWRNEGSGADAGKNRIWLMTGTVKSGEMALPTIGNENGSDWRVVGVGDFNRDGHPDLAWRDYGTDANAGKNIIWFLKNGVYYGWTAPPTITDTNWKIVAVGDFNGDGSPDLFWRNSVSGVNIAWFLVNGVYAGWGQPPTITDTTWQIVGSADYNGDGKADLLWRNATDGRNLIWYLRDGQYQGFAWVESLDLAWTTGARQ